ncbi:hypothetical protein FACS1894172_18520 [Spirochaetia bacterium]|nr:hypothetical protein FACS1894172_18520 [Spirochaetia bacterium]
MSRKLILSITIFVMIVVSLGIWLAMNPKPDAGEQEIKIAAKTSDYLGAPLLVIREMNLLQKYMPNLKLTIVSTESSAVSNEAIVANQVDGTIMGITNFLVGTEKRIPYKIAAPVSYLQLTIQTNNPSIKKITDISSDDKIAVSSYTGTNAFLLAAIAKKYFGNYRALDRNFVIMDSADALIALINKSGISLQFGDAAQRKRANEAGCHTIFEGIETKAINLCVFSDEFHDKHKELYNAFMQSLNEAIQLINNKDEQAIDVIAKHLVVDKEAILAQLETGDIGFSSDFHNINFDEYIDIALELELISSVISIQDIIFEYGD